MATHAVLVTWQNMETKVLAQLLTRASAKYGARFTRVHFDGGGASAGLLAAVRGVPATDRLKVFVSGHGNTGTDNITDDTQTQKQTIGELVTLLATGLAPRATTAETSSHTQVTMVSCLFGRTPDGTSLSSAERLHRALAARRVYVDLVARTESVVEQAAGRATTTTLNYFIYVPRFGKQPKFFQRRVEYSKLLCTFVGGAPVSKRCLYDRDPSDPDSVNTYVNNDTLEGRRLLWADYAIAELVKRIKLEKTGAADDDVDVIDVRQKAIRDIVTYYEVLHRPDKLREKLAAVVDGTGTTDATNFTTHRSELGRRLSFLFQPATAKLVRHLLEAWPAR